MVPHPLLATIRGKLEGTGSRDAVLRAVLDDVLQHFDCVVGSIHGVDPQSGMLTLKAHCGLPDALLDKVRLIPIGKGMAGLAAQRREPVQVCNLQQDSTGVAKPSARETQMAGSVAVPILFDQSLRGTLGIAKPVEHEFDAAELGLLLQLGAVIGEFLP
jgi:L-methionine (R)-S-oxide reductase